MHSFYTIYTACKNSSNFLFKQKIDCDTAQGSCGILSVNNLKIKEHSLIDCREIIIENKTDNVFYKYGNTGWNCTLARQEYVIADGLLKSCSHLPNFMRPISYIKNHFVRKDKCSNPFDIENIKNKNKISCVDVTVYEYLKEKLTLWDLLSSSDPKVYESCKVESLILQTCLAIICAQQNSKFVHNDLHANNILLVECSKNLKMLYRLDICGKERLFVVPTYGLIPIIIDYGFSYSEDCKNMSLECIDSDNYGLITYKFDSISDFIRLFVVLKRTVKNKNLVLTLDNMFHSLPISMKTSWEKIVDKDSCHYTEEIFKNAYGYSKFQKEKVLANQIHRLLLRTIVLPLKYCSEYENIDLKANLIVLFQEWSNIEKWFKYDYEKVYVFRELTDAVRKYKNNQDKIVHYVNVSVKNVIDKDIPLNVNWNLLVQSITASRRAMERILYKRVKYLDEKRKKYLYSCLKSGEHMFSRILKDIYTPNNVNVKSGDFLLLIDNKEKVNAIIKLSEDGIYIESDLYNIFKEEIKETEPTKNLSEIDVSEPDDKQ